MAVMWSGSVARKVATGICNINGITVRTVDTPGFIPNANPDSRVIELGPFNILNSLEYLLHMYHEMGHLFPENLWHWDTHKILRGQCERGTEHPVALHVLNILADYMADKSRKGDYDGRDKALARGYLDLTTKTDDYIGKILKKSKLIAAIYCVDLHMRSNWMCELPYQIPQEIEHIVEALLDYNYEARLELCETPAELIALVKDIMKEADDAEKKQQQQQQQQQQKNPKPGESSGKPADEQGTSDPNTPQGVTTSDSNLYGSPQDLKKLEEDQKGTIKKMPDVQATTFDTSGGASYVPKEEWRTVDTRGVGHTDEWYKAILKELDGHNVSRNVRKYLAAMKQRAYIGGRQSGKIHGKNLHRVLTQQVNPRVFRQREAQRLETSSAFHILSDCSGSMKNERHVVASACAISCIETCQSLQIPSGSRGFSDIRGGRNQDIIFKEFKERPVPREELARRYASQNFTMSINADAESIVRAHDILMERSESNKILIVLSDGSPTGGSGVGDRHAYLRDVCHRIHHESPVRLFAIGIDTESVKNYYVDYCVLKSVKDLEEELTRLLKESFLK